MYKAREVPNVSMKGVAIVASLCMLFVTGCASTGTTPSYYSGYLHDYSQLKPSPNYQGMLLWVDPDVDRRKYRRFIVDPVTVYFPPGLRGNEGGVDPEVINKLTNYLHKAIVQALEPNYPVVKDADHDVARIEVAITGVELQRKDLSAYQYLPVALVVTGVGEATGTRNRVAVAMMEGEFSDSLTGQRIGIVVQQAGEEVSVGTAQDVRGKHVFPVLDYWAKLLRKRIDSIHFVR